MARLPGLVAPIQGGAIQSIYGILKVQLRSTLWRLSPRPYRPNLWGYLRAGQGCGSTRGASLPLMRLRVAPTIGPPARCWIGACAQAV